MAEDRMLQYGDTIFMKDLLRQGIFVCKKRKVCQAVIQQLTEEAQDTPPDLKDSTFIVVPKLSYSHVQRMLKHEKMHNATPEDDWPDKIQRTVAKYRKLAKIEKGANKELVGKMQGSGVPLGSTIMLWHTKSESFLTMLKEGADKDTNALKLVLELEGTKSAWFDLLPGFKTSKVGDNLPYGSSVMLRSTKNDIPLHVSDEVDTGMPVPHHYCTRVIEVNCFVNPAVFAVYPYKEPSKKEYDLTLSSGDVISLYHADSDSSLVCRDGRSCRTYRALRNDHCLIFAGFSFIRTILLQERTLLQWILLHCGIMRRRNPIGVELSLVQARCTGSGTSPVVLCFVRLR